MMKKLIAIAALAAVLISSAFALEFNTIEDLDGKNIGVQTAVLYEELIMDRVPHSNTCLHFFIFFMECVFITMN